MIRWGRCATMPRCPFTSQLPRLCSPNQATRTRYTLLQRLLCLKMAQRNNGNRDGASPSRQSEATLCKYQGKRCLNPRAVKTTGELHNLCDQHRKNANSTQRKSQWAKRMKVKANSSESMRLTLDDSLFQHGRGEVADERRCRYSKGQNCKSVRAIKTNGERHRFCDYHAGQAKVHRQKSLQKNRGSGLDSASHPTFGSSAAFTYQKFQCIGSKQCEVSTSHGLGYLTLGVDFFATDDNAVDLALETVGNIQPREPLHAMTDNVYDDEMSLLHPHLPPWLPDFVDEIYTSLNQWLQRSHADFKAI
jgi:hypothetical protein